MLPPPRTKLGEVVPLTFTSLVLVKLSIDTCCPSLDDALPIPKALGASVAECRGGLDNDLVRESEERFVID